MYVVVIGASGVLGAHLVPRLLEAGHRVRATAREPTAMTARGWAGAELGAADMLDRASLDAAVAGADVVVNAATAVPRPGSEPDWSANDAIRTRGTANLIAACRAGGVSRLVQQSIALLVPSVGDAWVDESAPVETNERTASALHMEEQVKGCALSWRIVRGGLFYGPGTGREAFWLEQARAGALQLPGGGDDFVSLVHVADYAAALVAAVEWKGDGLVVNAVDDSPVTWAQLFGSLCEVIGAPAPRPGGPRLQPSFRARNARARSLLRWRPFYRSFRTGLLAAVSVEPGG